MFVGYHLQGRGLPVIAGAILLVLLVAGCEGLGWPFGPRPLESAEAQEARPEAELLAVLRHVRFGVMAEGFLRETDTTATAALLKALMDGVELLSALEYPLDRNALLATGLEVLLRGLAKPIEG